MLIILTSSTPESEQCATNPHTHWRKRYIGAVNSHSRRPGTGTIDTIIIDDFMVGDDKVWEKGLEILSPVTKSPNDEFDASHLSTATMLKADYATSNPRC